MIKLLIALLLLPILGLSQITYFGSSAAVPTDNGSNVTSTITLTPPTSMQENDFVYVLLYQRGTAAITVSTTGGQFWSSGGSATTENSLTNISVQIFWCNFKGSWDANPVFSFSTATNTNGIMYVFRPTSGFVLAPDEYGPGFLGTAFNAQTTTTVNLGPGTFVPKQANNLCVVSAVTADDNTWTLSTANGYTFWGYNRNIAGSDMSHATAYKMGTSLSSFGSPVFTQATLGADNSRTIVSIFRERAVFKNSRFFFTQ